MAAREGRDDLTLRPTFSRVGVNAAASGSAYVEMGHTKVSASVFGPREAPGARAYSAAAALDCEVRYAPFATRPRRERTPETMDADRQASLGLERALAPCALLHRYPKAVIDVAVVVLEADGGEDAACLLAAALALIDAGVEMLDVPAAATVACVRQPGAADRLLVDPDAGELARAAYSSHVVVLPRVGTVMRAVHSGEAEPAAFVRCITVAFDACLTQFDVAKGALVAAARRRAAPAASPGAAVDPVA